ncbi:hypothetical protein NE865_04501 [Phthorimaea operculella]|nr:hypothetical protein NE865_04501 [Phthorimaea operculella]
MVVYWTSAFPRCDTWHIIPLSPSIREDTLRLLDEVLVNQKTLATEEIFKILQYVLGDKFPDLDPDDFICSDCMKSTRHSYTFIKMCDNSSAQLTNMVNILSDSFENTSDHLSDCKSLFVQVQMEDFSVTQYYDTKQFDKNITIALARFRFLLKGTDKNPLKRVTRTNMRTPRIHNYSEEMSNICDIIRENNRSKFKCKVCNVLFNKSYNFKKHYYSQHSAKQVECSECGRCYGSEALLKQHKYDSHASITCSICGKSYKNRYSLLYHMRQHSGEQPYQCQHCDMKFQWSSRRAEHIRRYHLEPSVECDICHNMFRSLGSLYDHRKRHFNPNSRLHVTQQTPPVAEEEEVNTESLLETKN